MKVRLFRILSIYYIVEVGGGVVINFTAAGFGKSTMVSPLVRADCAESGGQTRARN